MRSTKPRRPRFLLAALLATLACLTRAPAAVAQSNGALAEQLFLEGQRLLEAGKVREACERLAASERLDPALGTLINLALCHEREGKTATAWSEYEDAAAQAARRGERDREAFARDHAAALRNGLARVVVTVAPLQAGTRVTLDGAALPGDAIGAEIPIDPGDHAVEVTASGKKPWRDLQIHVEPGSVARVAASLEDEPIPAVETPAPPPAAPKRRDPRVPGYVVGGIGIAGVGAAVVLLARAAAFDTKSDEEARKARLFTPVDPRFRDASLSDHRAAVNNQTIGLVVGGISTVALVTGLYVVLSRHTDTAGWLVVPSAGLDRAGLDLSRAF